MRDEGNLPRTERTNPASIGIDRLDARGIVEIIHREDRKAWEALVGVLGAIAELVDLVVAAFASGGRLLYVGAGTSGRLGVLDASECPPTFGVSPELVIGLIAGGDTALRESIEGAEDDPPDGAAAMRRNGVSELDVVCGIAASGSTPYVLGALLEARARGARTALITCNELDAEQREASNAELLIELPVGPEVVTGSTRMKAGTATKMALNMITTAAMIRSGKVHDNLMVDVRPVNAKLVKRARRLIERLGEVDEKRAGELLEASGRDVKVAIVMARRGVDRARATALLDGWGGRIRPAIDK